ncbi:isopentenyl-diphosphate Delta-isomerase [Nocardioides fonticola]|uniref:Isopentenyl-diphosphate Delta-isomerase n=1 Tax=Nocardioides fonticola TaxID=450363 RepID=A0ABP7XIH2_9ACTN
MASIPTAPPEPPAPLDLVVLLDDTARPTGTADRLGVHTDDTPLHLAFSLYVLDTDGRLLLTRRALGKRTWPGVWTNACCGHPRPGEDMADAVRRRVHEELGLRIDDPAVVLPDFRYRAVDVSGVVEHEVCPVHLVVVPAGITLLPDPEEVADLTWVPWPDVRALVAAAPSLVSPWMALQVAELGERHGDALAAAVAGPTEAGS